MTAITNLLSKLQITPHASVIYSNLEDWPSNPTNGQTCFYDQILYIYSTVSGVDGWVPLTNKKTVYIHQQAVANIVWTINHSLNSIDFIFTVYDSTNNVIQLVSPQILDENNFTITFTEATAGKVIVFVSSESQQILALSDMFTKDNNGNIVAGGNIISAGDGTYSLGSPDKPWKDLYISGNTIYLGSNGSTISGSGINIVADPNATSLADQPQLQVSKLTLNNFTYNDGSANITVPAKIEFDSDLTLGDGTKSINLNSGSQKIIVNSSNFSVDQYGNASFSGTLQGVNLDGGTF